MPALEESESEGALGAPRLDGADAESELPPVGLVLGQGEGVVGVDGGAAAGRGGAVGVRGGMVASLITRVFHIERHELKKFLYMSFMMFAIIYVFTMTRQASGCTWYMIACSYGAVLSYHGDDGDAIMAVFTKAERQRKRHIYIYISPQREGSARRLIPFWTET